MKVMKSDLLKALELVKSAVMKKAILFHEDSVFLEVFNNQLHLLTSGSHSCTASIGYISGETDEFQACVPYRTLNDLLEAYWGEDVVEFGYEEETATLSLCCGKNSSHIKGFLPELFPERPKISDDCHSKIVVNAEHLYKIFRATSLATLRADDPRTALTGVLVSIDGDEINAAATDGNILSMRGREIIPGLPSSHIVPGGFVKNLMAVLRNSAQDMVTLTIDESLVDVSSDFWSMCVKPLVADFPAYGPFIPKTSNAIFSVERKELLQAIRQVSALALNSTMRMTPQVDGVSLLLDSLDKSEGNASALIPMVMSFGSGTTPILFRKGYMTDIVRSIDNKQVEIRLLSSNEPVVICDSETAAKHIMMPCWGMEN